MATINLDELAQKQAELDAQKSDLRARIARGEDTTGDGIRDYVYVYTGEVLSEVEDHIRDMYTRLESAVDNLVMVAAHISEGHDRPDTLGGPRSESKLYLKAGILIDKPRFNYGPSTKEFGPRIHLPMNVHFNEVVSYPYKTELGATRSLVPFTNSAWGVADETFDNWKPYAGDVMLIGPDVMHAQGHAIFPQRALGVFTTEDEITKNLPGHTFGKQAYDNVFNDLLELVTRP